METRALSGSWAWKDCAVYVHEGVLTWGSLKVRPHILSGPGALYHLGNIIIYI